MRNFLKLLFLSSILFFTACEGNKKEGNDKPLSPKHGGVLNMNLDDNIVTLYPSNITHFTSILVSDQIYEGLVRINSETSKVEPAISDSWETNEDATSYTFHIRNNVRFHKTDSFEGRAVVANDAKTSFTQFCKAKDNNFYAKFLIQKIEGAAEYYESTKNKDGKVKEVIGFVAVNDSTFKINLKSSFRGLEKILSIGVFAIYPQEVFAKGDFNNLNIPIGTGPFKIKHIVDGEKVELVRNENYWGKDADGLALPYLDEVNFSFTLAKSDEIEEFKKGELNLIKDIPVDEISNILPSLAEAKAGDNVDFNYISSPGLDIKMMMFNHNKEVFKNINVRKAFNYAINREKLVDSVLLGDRNAAKNGLIPHSEIFGNYEVKGFSYDPQKAQEYLALAGYPNGKGFPSITVQNIQRRIDTLAVNEAVRMLNETLNLNITVDNNNTVNSIADKVESMTEKNTMDMWRYNWIADYPDPETFLQLFFADNATSYKNKDFNNLMEKALEEANEDKRYKIYFDADQLLIDDAAFIPLLYNDLIFLTSKNLKGFKANPLDYRDFREVYFEKSEQ